MKYPSPNRSSWNRLVNGRERPTLWWHNLSKGTGEIHIKRPSEALQGEDTVVLVKAENIRAKSKKVTEVISVLLVEPLGPPYPIQHYFGQKVKVTKRAD